MSTVKPTLPAGMRDYLPADMLFMQKTLDTIRRVFETFGFSPIETPGIEREEVLTGGKPLDMVIWRTATSRAQVGDGQLALHFDLTVPLARVFAANMNRLPRPFRRYQCQKVWRGEKPQAGRFREFRQFDADIVGSTSLLADTEIIWLIVETMRAIGFERFLARFSTRKALDGLAEKLALKPGGEQARDLFRILDKRDKIGQDGVEALLRERYVQPEDRDPNDPDATVSGLELSEDQVALVRHFLAIRGSSDDILNGLDAFFDTGNVGREGAADLREIVGNLRDIGVAERYWTIDLSVVRGLAYYTGPVFETTLRDLPEFSSVMGGGRFDDLVARFTGESMPATGVSIGPDRLFEAMETLNMVKGPKTTTQVLITIMDRRFIGNCLAALKNLRDAGIPSEIYSGDGLALKAQMAYALKQGIRFVVFVGENEANSGRVSLKDTEKRLQENFPVGEIAEAVKARLAG